MEGKPVGDWDDLLSRSLEESSVDRDHCLPPNNALVTQWTLIYAPVCRCASNAEKANGHMQVRVLPGAPDNHMSIQDLRQID